jgi:hypothetical protein
VFSHTQKPPSDIMQAAVGSLRDRHLLHLARTARRVSAPVAMAAANGARPAASVRLCRVRLDRGYTAYLHLAAWVELFAHAPALLALLRKCHQARRIGSLFVQAPSSGRHAPCRAVGPLARPRARLPPWRCQRRQPRSSARFSAVAYFVAASSPAYAGGWVLSASHYSLCSRSLIFLLVWE